MNNTRMKHIITKFLILSISILMTGTICGCTSDTSVKTYLQALLDASYKNDSSAFVEMKLGSEEAAQTLYEQGIDTGVEVFCNKLGVSDEYKEEFRQVYMDMLAKVRYTVESAEKQSDGSYIVTVTYEKMNIFKPALALHQDNMVVMAEEWRDASEPPTEEAMMAAVFLDFKSSMEIILAEVQYSEPVSMTVRIELDGNVYTPNADDIVELEKALFDGE
ncbi:MAG: hypothetical protein K2G51_02550 [Lachnospiraceae bacterium]|nr:hypothetical protein [Lachnospiraceae bacterium]MDE7273816.1 hypothetical protein [Lachnospiraceae bacterium]